MSTLISSIQNPRIKQLLTLSKPGIRKKENLFIIEGIREIMRAKENGVEILSVFYCLETLGVDAKKHLGKLTGSSESFEVSSQVYSKIAYRENFDGIIVVAKTWEMTLEKLELPTDPLVVVLESVEKPGNIGAVMRTADAAGVDAIIICDTQTDIFNPNVVRSSLGCLFSNQIAISTSDLTVSFLQSNKIRIFSAVLQDSIPYTEIEYKGSAAIVLGSEAEGLSETWRRNASRRIKIPMSGIADSLNVSVSAAVIVFEAVRQRSGRP